MAVSPVLCDWSSVPETATLPTKRMTGSLNFCGRKHLHLVCLILTVGLTLFHLATELQKLPAASSPVVFQPYLHSSDISSKEPPPDYPGLVLAGVPAEQGDDIENPQTTTTT